MQNEIKEKLAVSIRDSFNSNDIDVIPIVEAVWDVIAEPANWEVVNQWQPIETAPKDGTVVILWDSVYKEPVVANYSHGHWWINNSYGFNEDGEVPESDVTHWQPLPKPPGE